MEKKLAEFRASRRLKERQQGKTMSQEHEDNKKDNNISSQVIRQESNSVSSVLDNDNYGSETECGYIQRIFRKLYSAKSLLQFALWFSLLLFFIEIEFGAVYFIVSLTIIMYFSMKKGKSNGPSAYSVFNKDCERIDGTFTAEQFEQQMIYGGAVR
ncbi:SAYSvFN domain-containing protein 1-like [Hydractinia symbiolongicarpus]|uniref:SAYSvFN domain-containing protein 1-like n=1 Tax=Hydractinia symbiolongicarpus TaxID=13093 RepID=UPI00254D9AA6|nr:SAYSvFN domain-containing protein 1-like [Hydractinia symbiolongicarpus]